MITSVIIKLKRLANLSKPPRLILQKSRIESESIQEVISQKDLRNALDLHRSNITPK